MPSTLNQVQPDSKDFLYDNYGIYYTPFWRTTWFLTIIGIIILCILVATAVYFWRKHNKKIITSWDVALDELADLETQIRNHRTTSQNVYVSLTTIFKNYLHARYGYQLFNKTDEEIAAFVSTADIPEMVRKQLLDLFSSASTLKFSGQTVDEQTMMHVIDQARVALQATIPTEPELKK
jgi:septation ring formation regulator EzrA